MKTLITNGEIFTPTSHIENGSILIDDKLISAVGTADQFSIPSEMKVIDAGGKKIIPGLIDTHIHGAGGYDMTGSGVREAAQYLGNKGITSFLATTHFMMSHKELVKSIADITDVIESPPSGAKILGIHMEGPWIASDRSPFSEPEFCYPITREDIQLFQKASHDHLRMVTFAPELPGALEVIPWLKENHIIPSVGHTNADYYTVVKAVELGLNHSTHTYNAMQPFHHRKPGTLGAVFDIAEIYAELIADGFHVLPPAMRLLIKAKGVEKVCLVSDAVPLAGLPAGTIYDWYGFNISTDGQISILPDGRPAGAYKLLNQDLKVLVETQVATFAEGLFMASSVPAKIFNLNKGQLSPGFDADIVVMDDQYLPLLTMVEGQSVFSNGL